jgi:hypothetical protein
VRTARVASVARLEFFSPREGLVTASAQASGQALVPFGAVRSQAPAEPSGHAYAPFVAHLIATRDRMAQTRARRRASASEATTAYRAGALCPYGRQTLLRSV